MKILVTAGSTQMPIDHVRTLEYFQRQDWNINRLL